MHYLFEYSTYSINDISLLLNTNIVIKMHNISLKYCFIIKQRKTKKKKNKTIYVTHKFTNKTKQNTQIKTKKKQALNIGKCQSF